LTRLFGGGRGDGLIWGGEPKPEHFKEEMPA